MMWTCPECGANMELVDEWIHPQPDPEGIERECDMLCFECHFEMITVEKNGRTVSASVSYSDKGTTEVKVDS